MVVVWLMKKDYIDDDQLGVSTVPQQLPRDSCVNGDVGSWQLSCPLSKRKAEKIK